MTRSTKSVLWLTANTADAGITVWGTQTHRMREANPLWVDLVSSSPETFVVLKMALALLFLVVIIQKVPRVLIPLTALQWMVVVWNVAIIVVS